MNMSNYLENKLIDFLLRAQAFVPPATLYIGLWTVTLDDTSTGSTTGEPSGAAGYARQPIVSGPTTWGATDAPGSTVNPSTGTSGTSYNQNAVTYPAASSSWGTITYAAILDAASGGNMLWWAPLTTPQAVAASQVFQFAAQALSVQIDN